MGGRRRRDRILDVGTGLVLLLALALVVDARVLPAWRASTAVEVGERVPADLTFRALASGEPVSLGHDAPTLLLVYRSDCPACRRLAPRWRALTADVRPEVRVFAVALEPAEPALAYARRELTGALAVRPESRERFLRIAAVEAVPTTLYLDRRGRLRVRRTGELSDHDVSVLLDAAGVRPGRADRPTLPSSDRR